MLVIGIVLLVVVVIVLARLFSAKRKGVDAGEVLPSEVGVNRAITRIDPGPMMEVMPLPDEYTDEAQASEPNYDATDDLLDPRNPHHLEWISEHPDDATNVDLDQGDTGPTATPS